MSEEQIALAKRAVACKGWRWMEGMGVVDGDGLKNRVTRVEPVDMYGDGVEVVPWEMVHRLVADSCCSQWREHGILPDLTDPATLGCVLALVREAHAVPFLQVSVKISREHGYQFDCHPHHRGQWVDSEAEALVAALEAAP
jgi:hypothetical protein